MNLSCFYIVASDGTTSATFYDTGTILGIVGSDVLSIDLSKISASFDNKNTGQNKVVTFSGFSIEGIDSFKYNLFEQPKNSTATISPLETTISGVISENKVYDGTTNAEISGADVVDQKINSDDVNILKGKANFSDKKVSANKIVTFSDFKLIGNDATNYTLVSQPQSVYADITPKNLTINVTISDKKYDGINTASFSEAPTINGVVQNDNVILINGKPIFSSISIGTNIEIIFETDFSIEGNDSYNYTLIQPTGITGNILSGFTPIKDIHYIISQPDGLILTDNSSNGWYQSDDFKIIAKDGYKVSTSNTDTSNWTNELIYSDETHDNSSIDIKFYVRNIDQNEISSSKIESYKKDETAPTFKITESGDYTDKIFVRTFDNAGNISNLSSPYTVKLNKQVNDVFDQTDEATGIKAQAISGVVPKGTRLVIDKLDQTTLERSQEYKKVYGQIDENIKKTMERYKLFEIHLLDIQGNIIQPNGFVTISIPIPDYFDKTKEDIDVYRIQSGLDDDDDFDEHIKEIGGTYYCVFDTNHFSPYALIDKNTNISKYNNPNIIIILSFILLLISLIIFLIIFFLKKRKK